MALKKYYQLVSNDNIELPLSEPMSASELSKKLGLTSSCVRFYSSAKYFARLNESKKHYQSRKKSYKIIAFYVDFESDNDESDNTTNAMNQQEYTLSSGRDEQTT